MLTVCFVCATAFQSQLLSFADFFIVLAPARPWTVSSYSAVATLLGSLLPEEFGIVLTDFGPHVRKGSGSLALPCIY